MSTNDPRVCPEHSGDYAYCFYAEGKCINCGREEPGYVGKVNVRGFEALNQRMEALQKTLDAILEELRKGR